MDPELAAALAAINNKLDAQQPFLDGIQLLGKSIEILQRDVQTLRGDVRILRDDLHVTSAMAMRVDTTLSSLVAEFSAIHRWMSGVNSRLRELESKP